MRQTVLFLSIFILLGCSKNQESPLIIEYWPSPFPDMSRGAADLYSADSYRFFPELRLYTFRKRHEYWSFQADPVLYPPKVLSDFHILLTKGTKEDRDDPNDRKKIEINTRLRQVNAISDHLCLAGNIDHLKILHRLFLNLEKLPYELVYTDKKSAIKSHSMRRAANNTSLCIRILLAPSYNGDLNAILAAVPEARFILPINEVLNDYFYFRSFYRYLYFLLFPETRKHIDFDQLQNRIHELEKRLSGDGFWSSVRIAYKNNGAPKDAFKNMTYSRIGRDDLSWNHKFNEYLFDYSESLASFNRSFRAPFYEDPFSHFSVRRQHKYALEIGTLSHLYSILLLSYSYRQGYLLDGTIYALIDSEEKQPVRTTIPHRRDVLNIDLVENLDPQLMRVSRVWFSLQKQLLYLCKDEIPDGLTENKMPSQGLINVSEQLKGKNEPALRTLNYILGKCQL